MIKKSFFLLAVVLIFGSCGVFKRGSVIETGVIEIERLSDDFDVQVLRSDEFSINRASLEYKDAENDLNVRISLKVKQDSFIFASISAVLGIEIARALLEPDRIQIIDRINNNYIVDDYNYLNKLIGFDPGFSLMQRILSGNYRFQDLGVSPDSEIMKDAELIVVFDQNNSFLEGYKDARFSISNKDYKLRRAEFFNRKDERFLIMEYQLYTLTEKGLFPGGIKVTYSKGGRSEVIQLSYGRPVFDSNMKINFQVPERYKR